MAAHLVSLVRRSPSRNSFELVVEPLSGVGVADDVLTEAAHGTVLAPRHLVLGVDVGLPDQPLVCGSGRGWHLGPHRVFLREILEGSPFLGSSNSLLLLSMSELFAHGHVDLLLHLRLVDHELGAHRVAVAVAAEVFELVLGPELLLDALRPRLVLVVVTYHRTNKILSY